LQWSDEEVKKYGSIPAIDSNITSKEVNAFWTYLATALQSLHIRTKEHGVRNATLET
jgi:hypothetical protein